MLAPIVLGTSCQDPPPAFEEHTFDNVDPNGAGANGGAADAQRAGNNGLASGGAGEAGSVPGEAKTIEKSFVASRGEKVQLTHNWGSDAADQVIKMQYETVETSTVHQQSGSAQSTEIFGQGSASNQKSESFVQKGEGSGVLDILVVVDTSGSMKEEQLNLASKLSPLLQYVSSSQWRIGVVTTDPREGCMRGLINHSDPNASSAYAAAVAAGTQGSGNERGILQAVNGLRCNGGSWLRPNSTVAVLIVSDEDNCSNGLDCAGEPWASSSYLIDYLDSIRQVGVNARVYGIVWRSTDSAAQCSTGYNQGNIYSDLVTQTGGTLGSICETDYTPTLHAISKNISVILKNQFALAYAPTAGSVKVYVNGALITNGYSLSGNVIEFQSAPAAGSTIKVDYEYQTSAPSNEFILAKDADPTTLEVFLDGAKAVAGSFSYVAESRKVVFGSAPAAREIKVVYLDKASLRTEFPLAEDYVRDSLVVKVNGAAVSPDNYSSIVEQQLVRFHSAPAANSRVEFLYHKIVRPRLRYATVGGNDSLKLADVIDTVTGASLEYGMDGNMIVINDRDFEVGRVLEARYRTTMQTTASVDIVHSIYPGSPIVVTGESSGACDVSGSIRGTVVNLGHCGFSNGEQITLELTVLSEIIREFSVEDESLKEPEKFVWTVKVNGTPISAYKREGTLITIEGLKVGDLVTVVAGSNL
jgi:hypothetical protein